MRLPGGNISSDQQFQSPSERKEAGLEEKNQTEDRSTWAVGGCLLLGVGAGFFFLHESAFAFVGCIIGGLGLGLLVSSILAAIGKNR